MSFDLVISLSGMYLKDTFGCEWEHSSVLIYSMLQNIATTAQQEKGGEIMACLHGRILSNLKINILEE